MSELELCYDLSGGELVEFFHYRPHATCPTTDLVGCLRMLGFQDYHTGGGCMAMQIERGSDYLLVTEAEDPALPVNGEAIAVGSYDDDGDSTAAFTDGDVPVRTYEAADYIDALADIILWLGVAAPRFRTEKTTP